MDNSAPTYKMQNVQGFMSTNTLALTAVGLLVLIVGALFFFSGYVGGVQEAITGENAPVLTEDSTEITELTSPMGSQGRDSDIKGLDSLVSDIDLQLSAGNLTSDARKKLLISKAMALTAARSSTFPRESAKEAASILTSIFMSEVTNTDEDKYKFATIPLYATLLHASCYRSSIIEMLPSTYVTYYRSLLEEENLSDKQAILLTYDRFADEGNDRRYVQDSSITSQRAYMLALYFYAFGTDSLPSNLSPLSRDYALWNKLQALVATKTTTGLMGGPNRSVIDPAFRLAFAFDIANTYGNQDVSSTTHKEIDSKYEEVFELIEKTKDSNDPTSIAVTRILNSIYYLESMHRRYSTEELDQAKVQEVSQIFMDNVSFNMDTKELFAGFIIEGVSADGQWMPVRREFINVAAKYPVLVEYFGTTFGVDL